MHADEYGALVVCTGGGARVRTAGGGGDGPTAAAAAATHRGCGRLAEVARVLQTACRNMMPDWNDGQCREERNRQVLSGEFEVVGRHGGESMAYRQRGNRDGKCCAEVGPAWCFVQGLSCWFGAGSGCQGALGKRCLCGEGRHYLERLSNHRPVFLCLYLSYSVLHTRGRTLRHRSVRLQLYLLGDGPASNRHSITTVQPTYFK